MAEANRDPQRELTRLGGRVAPMVLLATAGLALHVPSALATSQCWITPGADSDTLSCSVDPAADLGISSATVHYAGTLETGIPFHGSLATTQSAANSTIIPRTAYPLSLTVSISLHTSSVPGLAVSGFTGVFSGVQASTYTSASPLVLPSPFSTWSLSISNQASGLLEAVFTETRRFVNIGPYYIANDPNATLMGVQSSFVVDPYAPTQVVVPSSSGPLEGTLTLIFETGEMKELPATIPGPGSYVVDASGLH